MASSVPPPETPTIEAHPVLDIFVEGLVRIEKMAAGNCRIVWYVGQQNNDGLGEKIVMVRLVTSIAALATVRRQLAAFEEIIGLGGLLN